MAEKIPRKTPTYPDVDLTKPLDHDKYPTSDNDCFGQEWQPDHKKCAMCADLVMCGIKFNAKQAKLVKQREKDKGGYLDSNLFDCIDPEDMITWLAHKPRTGKQFIDKIQSFSNCPDRTTCVYWCKSFLKEHSDRLSVGEDKIIIVTQ